MSKVQGPIFQPGRGGFIEKVRNLSHDKLWIKIFGGRSSYNTAAELMIHKILRAEIGELELLVAEHRKRHVTKSTADHIADLLMDMSKKLCRLENRIFPAEWEIPSTVVCRQHDFSKSDMAGRRVVNVQVELQQRKIIEHRRTESSIGCAFPEEMEKDTPISVFHNANRFFRKLLSSAVESLCCYRVNWIILDQENEPSEPPAKKRRCEENLPEENLPISEEAVLKFIRQMKPEGLKDMTTSLRSLETVLNRLAPEVDVEDHKNETHKNEEVAFDGNLDFYDPFPAMETHPIAIFDDDDDDAFDLFPVSIGPPRTAAKFRDEARQKCEDAVLAGPEHEGMEIDEEDECEEITVLEDEASKERRRREEENDAECEVRTAHKSDGKAAVESSVRTRRDKEDIEAEDKYLYGVVLERNDEDFGIEDREEDEGVREEDDDDYCEVIKVICKSDREAAVEGSVVAGRNDKQMEKHGGATEEDDDDDEYCKIIGIVENSDRNAAFGAIEPLGALEAIKTAATLEKNEIDSVEKNVPLQPIPASHSTDNELEDGEMIDVSEDEEEVRISQEECATETDPSDRVRQLLEKLLAEQLVVAKFDIADDEVLQRLSRHDRSAPRVMYEKSDVSAIGDAVFGPLYKNWVKKVSGQQGCKKEALDLMKMVVEQICRNREEILNGSKIQIAATQQFPKSCKDPVLFDEVRSFVRANMKAFFLMRDGQNSIVIVPQKYRLFLPENDTHTPRVDGKKSVLHTLFNCWSTQESEIFSEKIWAYCKHVMEDIVRTVFIVERDDKGELKFYHTGVYDDVPSERKRN